MSALTLDVDAILSTVQRIRGELASLGEGSPT